MVYRNCSGIRRILLDAPAKPSGIPLNLSGVHPGGSGAHRNRPDAHRNHSDAPKTVEIPHF
jgi:hypothetical protein